MSLFRLALANIAGSAFRSAVVFLCALLVAAFALATTLLMRGAQSSLQLAGQRLGADIVVVPKGTESKVDSALIMGTPQTIWMPRSNLAQVAAVPGVEIASPQLFMTTLRGASCCSLPQTYLVAYDPASDFTIRPWLQRNLPAGLSLGESVGGALTFVPQGAQYIKVYGYLLDLKGNLAPTGTALDQSLFFTFDTAQDIARISQTRAERPLDVLPDIISVIMVKVRPGADKHQVAQQIQQSVNGVAPIESSDLFEAYRREIGGMLATVVVVLGGTWLLSVLLISLVFSMMVNERRREIGVLGALGATRGYVLVSLLAEACLLALGGGALGALLAVVAIQWLRPAISGSLGLPFILPDALPLAELVLSGLALALAGVATAALVPAYRISRQEPALAMRE
jgi:putative ABC transport system permease protein